MASSTPPSLTATTKPYHHQNHPYPQSQPQNRHQNHRFAQKFNLSNSSTPRNHHHATTSRNNPNPTTSLSSLPPLPPSKPELGLDFRGKRSTRFVSKMHFGRPKTVLDSRHTSLAEEVLQQVLNFEHSNGKSIGNILWGYEFHLSGGSDDYIFLIRELGNRGECSKAMACFEFAVKRERKRNEQGKLASAVISTLGRLGRVDLAKGVFDKAKAEGYGNTVYSFSALISAYGRNGYCEDAIKVLESMKTSGLKPNLVTYNAVIDACGKGGMNFEQATEVFDEMVGNGVVPDRITYNSLLAVCSRSGLWEEARNLFSEMVYKGIDRDIFTFNTLLDAVCKAGEMELAFEIMREMSEKKVWPNVVTYSTMVDGCAKAGKLEEALSLFNEMKFVGISLDRMAYNTLVAIFARLGRFDEALGVCLEMENAGIKKDSVTYNALLVGYGKRGEFDEVQRLLEEMKLVNVSPNILTYSTLMDVYSKGGMYKEAMEIFREFKQAGMKADVVLYSSLIDVFCKNGMVEFAVSLLDEMTTEGIRPNVVTYNSIIDAFGRSATARLEDATTDEIDLSESEPSTCIVLNSVPESIIGFSEGDNQVIRIFKQLAAEKENPLKEGNIRNSQEISCILGLFHKMHELEIKPNVVTFSAILNACSRCDSFEDASVLLEELRLFHNQVYGVAHGLLMGSNKDVWIQAQSLFDEVRRMDSSTASAFYNSLTDMLWHFGQKRGAQMVMLEGKNRQVWENTWCDSCLDLHMMSSGAAQAMVHTWLLNIRSIVFEGRELPKLVSILTGWGKHSKVVGDGTLRRAVAALLTGISAPFHVAKSNLGRFVSSGAIVSAWLRESGTLEDLILQDDRIHPKNVQFERLPNLQMLTL
ncbi:hypothetical protein MKX01_003209 [Papaver californicum]|nr:hypothetical protein MKX01_003209 [Papaver californicum]